MKNKNTIIILVLVLVIIIAGVIFFTSRNKSDGITNVSTEIYNNGMRIVEMLKNDQISAPGMDEIFGEDWSYAVSQKLTEYRSSLYDISAYTDEEIDYLATIYYALCSKYHEKVMDVVIQAQIEGYVDYADTYDAETLREDFISDYNVAINAIDSKNIETIKSAIDEIDVERSVDKFTDYYVENFGERVDSMGNYGFGSDLFGLGDDNYSSGLGNSDFSLQ